MKTKQYLISFLENISTFIFIGIILSVSLMIMKIVQPIWPLTSLIFAVLVTGSGLGGAKISRILTILGLILYGISWYVAYRYNLILGQAIWTLGIASWFFGGFNILEKNN